MNTLIERATSETPPFFKRLRNWAGIVAGAATGAALLPIPGWAKLACTIIAAICGGIAGTSQLGTTNKQLSQK